MHHVNQALKAHKLFQRDRDYIVKGGEVVIIDEFTGRMMQGRRYSEGLHQALEAKEHVEIQPENQTLASITFQNYFRLYEQARRHDRHRGDRGQRVPRHLRARRGRDPDQRGRSPRRRARRDLSHGQGEVRRAIVPTIADCRRRGQPILVGTVSIEKSEQLSELLKDRKYIRSSGALRSRSRPRSSNDGKEGELKSLPFRHRRLPDRDWLQAEANSDPIPHQVLNARYHEQEASIVAQAGVPGGVTIATNMAGRGTDIQLGGNADYQLKDWIAEETQAGRAPDPAQIAKTRERLQADIKVKRQEALEAGGLYVLATERHESRRIDNQLRGRSGRQGDPGRSKFYLSLEDDLMRIFGSERMDSVLKTLGLQEGEAITHPWMNKSLEMAQKKVEARNFDIRKQILKYDDVMNDQRKVIFEQRLDIMGEQDVSATIKDLRHQLVHELVRQFIPEKAYAEQWDTKSLKEAIDGIFGMELPINEWANEEGIADQEIEERILKAVDEKTEAKERELGSENFRQIEKMVLLQTLDHLWREHLVTLEHLRQVIGFRAYGQRDPLNEYKSEAFVLFEGVLSRLREAVTGQLMHVELAPPNEQPELQAPELPKMEAHHTDPFSGL